MGGRPASELDPFTSFPFKRYSPVDFIFPLIASAKELLLVILFFTASSRGRFTFRGFSFCCALFSGCFFLGIVFLCLGEGYFAVCA